MNFQTSALQVRSVIKEESIEIIVFMAAGSSNGRTTDSESVYLGSNPSPAAMNGIDSSFITLAHLNVGPQTLNPSILVRIQVRQHTTKSLAYRQ